MLVEKQLLVGRQRGEEIGKRNALRAVAYNHTHHCCRVAVYLVVFGCVHNAGIVELAKTLGYDAYVFGRKARDAVVIVGLELFHLLLLHRLVVVVVGLVGLKQRVFLCLDSFVGLVDRKVEFGYERTIHPRLADIVLKLLALVAW